MKRPKERTPNSALYDGRPYALAIGCLSGLLAGRVVPRIPNRARVLDAACGTGELALKMADRCVEVIGVDLSPRQVAQAERSRARAGVGNVSFRVGDAARLDDFPAARFDRATMVLSIHEMPAAFRPAVLVELGRVATEVLVVDFTCPLPRNLAGLSLRLVEMMTGPRHFGCFLSYQRAGGLAPVAAAAGLAIVERAIWSGVLDAFSLRAR